jgi:hypothetical protein
MILYGESRLLVGVCREGFEQTKFSKVLVYLQQRIVFVGIGT